MNIDSNYKYIRMIQMGKSQIQKHKFQTNSKNRRQISFEFYSGHSGYSSRSKGFTLIELLVVVAIIGLLASVITSGFNSSRVKSRDTRRVTDLKQIKTGMDIYFANASGYPTTADWNAAVGMQLTCSGSTIMIVPTDPLSPAQDYAYTAIGSTSAGCGTTVNAGYEVQFYIENKALSYIMNEDGNVREAVSGNAVSFDDLL